MLDRIFTPVVPALITGLVLRGVVGCTSEDVIIVDEGDTSTEEPPTRSDIRQLLLAEPDYYSFAEVLQCHLGVVMSSLGSILPGHDVRTDRMPGLFG
jgi:hypothetical protein